MNFRLSLLILVCVSAEAQHTQKAHDHGAAQLNISVDGKTAVIEFESPAQSIIGFEHAARTAEEKKKQEAAFAIFRNQFGMLVVLDPKLGCGFSARKGALEKDDDEPAPAPAAKGMKAAEHSDVKAEIAVSSFEAPRRKQGAIWVCQGIPRCPGSQCPGTVRLWTERCAN